MSIVIGERVGIASIEGRDNQVKDGSDLEAAKARTIKVDKISQKSLKIVAPGVQRKIKKPVVILDLEATHDISSVKVNKGSCSLVNDGTILIKDRSEPIKDGFVGINLKGIEDVEWDDELDIHSAPKPIVEDRAELAKKQIYVQKFNRALKDLPTIKNIRNQENFETLVKDEMDTNFCTREKATEIIIRDGLGLAQESLKSFGYSRPPEREKVGASALFDRREEILGQIKKGITFRKIEEIATTQPVVELLESEAVATNVSEGMFQALWNQLIALFGLSDVTAASYVGHVEGDTSITTKTFKDTIERETYTSTDLRAGVNMAVIGHRYEKRLVQEDSNGNTKMSVTLISERRDDGSSSHHSHVIHEDGSSVFIKIDIKGNRKLRSITKIDKNQNKIESKRAYIKINEEGGFQYMGEQGVKGLELSENFRTLALEGYNTADSLFKDIILDSIAS